MVHSWGLPCRDVRQKFLSDLEAEAQFRNRFRPRGDLSDVSSLPTYGKNPQQCFQCQPLEPPHQARPECQYHPEASVHPVAKTLGEREIERQRSAFHREAGRGRVFQKGRRNGLIPVCRGLLRPVTGRYIIHELCNSCFRWDVAGFVDFYFLGE
jgi:hypothetical protein